MKINNDRKNLSEAELQPISRGGRNRRRTELVVALVLATATLAGCGASREPSSDYATNSASITSESADSARSASGVTSQAAIANFDSAKAQGDKSSTQSVATQGDVSRKIIYTASLSLAVEDLTQAQKNLTRLVKQNGGYIAETNLGSSSGSPRSGTWKVRVPVERYEAFVSAASAMGELTNAQSDSDDVSAEYYDVEARIKNKKIEEARLIQLLQKATGKLGEILQVEKEISRVRGEVEQMEGRLRVLKNLSSLTTITLNINEIKDYKPPKPPTFANEIGRTFSKSLGNLGDFGKSVVLFIVSIVPWLPVWAIIFGIGAFLRRKYRKSSTRS